MRKNLVLSAVALLAISSLVGCSKPEIEEKESGEVSVGIIMQNQEAEGTGILREIRKESALVEMQNGHLFILQFGADAHIQANMNVGDKVLFVYEYNGGEFNGSDEDVSLIPDVISMRVVEKYVEETSVEVETLPADETPSVAETVEESLGGVTLDVYGKVEGLPEIPEALADSNVILVVEYGTVADVGEKEILIDLNRGKQVVAEIGIDTYVSEGLGIGSYVFLTYDGMIGGGTPALIPNVDAVSETFPVDADVEHEGVVIVETVGELTYMGVNEIHFTDEKGVKFIAKCDDKTFCDVGISVGEKVRVTHTLEMDESKSESVILTNIYFIEKR